MTSAALDLALGFDALVEGASNQLAVSAARSVADSPRPPFNPLLIHGGPGLGKTHLLHAVGRRRLEVDPQARVRYATWRELEEGWRASNALGRGEAFLDPWCEADLLLLDDLPSLTGSHPVPEALLALLEARQQAQRATILAGRRGPDDLSASGDRMARLVGTGLATEVGRPDVAMRWDILHRRGVEGASPLSPAVLQAVAALPFDSVRELVAAANRLVAFQAVSGTPLDPAQARVLVTGVLEEPAPDAGIRVSPPTPRPQRAAPPPRPAGDDEFGAFLSEVVAGVAEQVDEWRARVAQSIMRHQAEGYHTARLQALLDQELPAQPDLVLERFERDVARLRALHDDVREAAPELAAHEAFHDPDQLEVAEAIAERARTRDVAHRPPQPHLRLEDLVEGTSNRTALEAIRAIASAPGAATAALLLVGESGVGKTHLLHGLANALERRGLRGVVCLTALGFESEVQEALDVEQIADWRRRLRWAGALLVDDVHHLAGRGAAQAELCELIDRMTAEQRPVALTSAVPLTDLAGLSPQLLTRLASGRVVEVGRPDRAVRLGIVRHALAGTPAEGDAALADYLAGRPAESVREVHALVQRVLRAAEAASAEPSHALARQVLETPADVRATAGRGARRGHSGLGTLRDKLVLDWPDPADRLSEEMG
jgi:chromosomal replication initiation ATPase DnaA